jgi:hypothetical protein
LIKRDAATKIEKEAKLQNIPIGINLHFIVRDGPKDLYHGIIIT